MDIRNQKIAKVIQKLKKKFLSIVADSLRKYNPPKSYFSFIFTVCYHLIRRALISQIHFCNDNKQACKLKSLPEIEHE